jgi:hypothetical protein
MDIVVSVFIGEKKCLQFRIKEKKYYENDEHIIIFTTDVGQMLVIIVMSHKPF